MCNCAIVQTIYFTRGPKVQSTRQLHRLTFELLNIEADGGDDVRVLLLLRLEMVQESWFSCKDVLDSCWFEINWGQTWVVEADNQNICFLLPQSQHRDQLVEEPHEEDGDDKKFLSVFLEEW